MIYKLIAKVDARQQDFVFCVETGSSIPFDPDNTDYQAYLKWVAEGNTPLPADEVKA